MEVERGSLDFRVSLVKSLLFGKGKEKQSVTFD